MLATIDVSAAMVDRLSSAAADKGCWTQSCRRMTSPELALVAIVLICDGVASPRQSSGSTVQSQMLNRSASQHGCGTQAEVAVWWPKEGDRPPRDILNRAATCDVVGSQFLQRSGSGMWMSTAV